MKKHRIITLVLLLLVIITLCYTIQIVKVNGSSMQPTISDNDKLFLDRLAYKFSKVKYMDIVVVDVPSENDRKLIKRVIGVEGDHIVIKNNDLYINNNLISEKYIKEPMTSGDVDVTVPKDCIFVMGDNRNNSDDSRDPVVGVIKKDNILGRIICDSEGNPRRL